MRDDAADPRMTGDASFFGDRVSLFFRLLRCAGWKTTFRRTRNFLLYFLPTFRYRAVRNSPYYDRKWYLKTYFRSALPWIDPLRHFMEAGWQFGHCPSEQFPLTVYLFYHPELLEQNRCPLVDFMEKRYPKEYLTELCRRFDEDLKEIRKKLKWSRGIPPSQIPEQKTEERRIGVHLHCYYPDMLPGILRHLKQIPFPFDLFVSLPEEKAPEAGRVSEEAAAGLPQLLKCVIREVPNRGRDLAPLICTFGKELEEYDYICHIHTKRSPHLKDGLSWQDFLLEHLLGDEEWVRKIFFLLEHGTSVIYPRDFLSFPEPSGWGENQRPAQVFLDRTGRKIDLKKQFPILEFPQGSMFWARGKDLSDFLRLKIDYHDFPAEPVAADGSLAHVLEHLFLILVHEKCRSLFQIFRPEEEAFLQEKRYVYKEPDQP